MPFNVYFDSPTFYRNKFDFYNVGSSPLLINKLIDYLDRNTQQIEEIFLSFYIFNNATLHYKLVSLARAGVKVNVITIPIEGYDANSPKSIIDIATFQQQSVATKYDLARPIFAEHYRTPIPGFSLYLFPHMFIRSPYIIKFARGNMPYSLHTKSFLIKLKNRIGTVGISSSNFAVRDLVKEENLLIIEDEEKYYQPAAQYFTDLISVSIPFKEFDFKKDYTTYQVTLNRLEAEEWSMLDMSDYKLGSHRVITGYSGLSFEAA